jgi:hypothetical protein
MLDRREPEFAAWYESAPPEEKPVSPEILPHQQFYWLAWSDLRDDRHQDGFGFIGPISYATISMYAADHSIRGEQFMIFKRIIKAMDQAYRNFAHTKKSSPESS